MRRTLGRNLIYFFGEFSDLVFTVVSESERGAGVSF